MQTRTPRYHSKLMELIWIKVSFIYNLGTHFSFVNLEFWSLKYKPWKAKERRDY